MEDTLNLLGHALQKALGVSARQQGRGLATVATEAGTPILAASSLKAALDLDWDDPTARDTALATVLVTVDALTTWLATAPPGSALPTVTASMAVAQQVRAQDVVEPTEGPARVRQGVAKDRRISVEDGQMRHGPRVGRCGSTATSAISAATWTPCWCVPSASRRPTSRRRR